MTPRGPRQPQPLCDYFFLAHMQNLHTKSHSCQDMLRGSAKQVVAGIKETERVVDLGLHLTIEGEKRQ